MSVQTAKCPECEGRGNFPEMPELGLKAIQCETCEGTGESTARAGVSCTALVGASGVESEICPSCEGRGRRIWRGLIGDISEKCTDCDGKGRIRTIAPTTEVSDLPK